MSMRPFQCLLLACLSGLPIFAQSYQTSFTENKFDRARAPLIYHQGAQVDPATGAVTVDYPIGPGIGARGVVYQPHLSGRWAPQIACTTATAYDGISYYYSNINMLTSVGGFTFTPGHLDVVINSAELPAETNAYQIQSAPAISYAILPDGNRVSFNDIGGGPTPDIPQLLKSFGLDAYSLADPPTGFDISGSMWYGTTDELIICLTGPNAPTRQVPAYVSIPRAGGTSSNFSVPDRIVMVKRGIAYEYVYSIPVYWPAIPLGRSSNSAIISTTSSTKSSVVNPQMIQQPMLETIKSVCYRLERISNRYGDEILFTYTGTSSTATGFTANWNRNGVPMGPSIHVTASPLSITYIGGPNPITMTTTGQLNVNPSDDAEERQGLPGGRVGGVYQERPWFNNREFTISSFTMVEDDYTTSFTYDPVTLQGGNAGGGGLTSVTTPGSVTTLHWGAPVSYRRNFGTIGYDQNHYPEANANNVLDGNWNPMYFQGVIRVDEEDTSPSASPTRTTLYARTVPTPDLQAGRQAYWLNDKTTFNATVLYPDGSKTEFDYYEPVDGDIGATGPNQMQTLAHLKHLVHIEKHYGPDGITLIRTINYGDPSTLHMRTLVHPADGVVWGQGGSVPYATSVTSMDNLTGIISTIGLQNWSDTGYAWNSKVDLEGGIDHSITYRWEFLPAIWEGPRAIFEQRVGEPSCNTTFENNVTSLAPYCGRPSLKVFNQGGTPSLFLKYTYTTVPPVPTPDTVTLTGTGTVGLSAGASYQFDGFGMVNTITVSGVQGNLGESHDGFLRTVTQTDLNGFTRTIGWDDMSRLAAITPANLEWPTTINYDYDHLGAKVTHGNSNTTSYRYNGFGELVSIQKPTGETKIFRYDSGGRKIFESIFGNTSIGTTMTYAEPGSRLTSITDPNGIMTTITYSGANRTVTTGGSSTTFTKGGYGRTTDVLDPLAHLTHYDYDAGDRISAVTQYSGANMAGPVQIRSWIYNQMGWLTSLIQPESGTTGYTNFTVLGKPTTTNYADGTVLTTTYDASGRVTAVNSLGKSLIAPVTQTFAYDGGVPYNGKLRNSSDGAIQLSYAYMGLNGRISSLGITLPNSSGTTSNSTFNQTFHYDPSGLRSSATLPSGRTLSYGLDLTREIQNGVSGALGVPGFFGVSQTLAEMGGFNADYSPGTLKMLNGATTVFTYGNDLIRLASMAHTKVGANAFTKIWNYSYDAHGWMMNDGDAYPDTPGNEPYNYDLLGRLTFAKVKAPTGEDITQSFTYDSFGNRTSDIFPNGVPNEFQRNLVAWNLNGSEIAQMAHTNHLPSTANGVLTGAAYDLMGNLTQVGKQPGSTSPYLTLSYDALGRIVQMTDSGRSVTEKYYYTPEGLRMRIETYQGITPASLVLKKVDINLYNDLNQLVTEYEAVVASGALTGASMASSTLVNK